MRPPLPPRGGGAGSRGGARVDFAATVISLEAPAAENKPSPVVEAAKQRGRRASRLLEGKRGRLGGEEGWPVPAVVVGS